jgi:hypothetical protein
VHCFSRLTGDLMWKLEAGNNILCSMAADRGRLLLGGWTNDVSAFVPIA